MLIEDWNALTVGIHHYSKGLKAWIGLVTLTYTL